eukprot:6069829-Pyramimonas_sp.AAC.1
MFSLRRERYAVPSSSRNNALLTLCGGHNSWFAFFSSSTPSHPVQRTINNARDCVIEAALCAQIKVNTISVLPSLLSCATQCQQPNNPVFRLRDVFKQCGTTWLLALDTTSV